MARKDLQNFFKPWISLQLIMNLIKTSHSTCAKMTLFGKCQTDQANRGQLFHQEQVSASVFCSFCSFSFMTLQIFALSQEMHFVKRDIGKHDALREFMSSTKVCVCTLDQLWPGF